MRIGQPGTGQTCLAQCLAYAACNAHVMVRFPTALDMRNHRLAAEAAPSRWNPLHPDATPALRGCDALGSLSRGPQGSHRFCQVISQRPQRQSTVMTPTLPCAEGGKVVDSTPVATALADRLVHNSEVLRMGGSRERRQLPSSPSRPTTAVQGAFHASHRAPNALFWSLDKRQPGTRAAP